jgi:hypothetical protein
MPSNPPVGGVVLTKITLEDEYDEGCDQYPTAFTTLTAIGILRN